MFHSVLLVVFGHVRFYLAIFKAETGHLVALVPKRFRTVGKLPPVLIRVDRFLCLQQAVVISDRLISKKMKEWRELSILDYSLTFVVFSLGSPHLHFMPKLQYSHREGRQKNSKGPLELALGAQRAPSINNLGKTLHPIFFRKIGRKLFHRVRIIFF